MKKFLCSLLFAAPTFLLGQGIPFVTNKTDYVVLKDAAASGGGGSGAPADATYITQTPDATLSAEQALSALGTGLVLNTTTTGVLSIYAGASCTAQFPRSVNASGGWTCESVNLAADVTGDLPLSNLVQAAAASTLLGRGSAGGAGDWQAITLGNGLAMSSQVLSRDPNAQVSKPFWFDDFTAYASSTSSSCSDNGAYRTDQGAGTSDGETCSANTYDHPGVVTLTTDNSATGYASMSRDNGAAYGFGAGMTFEAMVQIPTLSVTASEGFTFRIGLCDSPTAVTGCTDGIAFWYSDNINGGEWEARTYKGGIGNVNTLDTNVAVVAGTWYKLKWVYSAGPSVEFFICTAAGPCSTSVGTINTAANIPGSTDYATVNVMLAKTVGTTARTAMLDYWWMQMTSAR